MTVYARKYLDFEVKPNKFLNKVRRPQYVRFCLCRHLNIVVNSVPIHNRKTPRQCIFDEFDVILTMHRR